MSMKNAKLYIFTTKKYTFSDCEKLPIFFTLQPLFSGYIMVSESKLLSIANLIKVHK